ncbi:hypothetical protein JCM10908_001806 [Rhodotorula pacifica]|uniref:uncharacterized protein n=1 Tax=Rhodotorula pacifica TaxID=1495444 RepID=UPI0031701E67
MATRLSQSELSSLRRAASLSTAEAEDLVTLASSSTASSRPNLPSDEKLAIQLWQQELRAFSSGLADQRLARDLREAERRGTSLEAIRRERERSERRAAADALGEGSTGSYGQRGTVPAPSPASTSNASPVASTSTSTSKPKPLFANDRHCVICYSSDVINFKVTHCGHRFCRPCLDHAFALAAKDESLFPPKCCHKPLVETAVIHFLTTAAHTEYYYAKREFETKNRVYCSEPSCSTFLGGDFKVSKQDLKCPKCKRMTCSACKAPTHPETQACAADTDGEAASKLAKQVHGVRCKSCLRVVERFGGCEHVVCRCGADLTIRA